jgi:hypothetical protein
MPSRSPRSTSRSISLRTPTSPKDLWRSTTSRARLSNEASGCNLRQPICTAASLLAGGVSVVVDLTLYPGFAQAGVAELRQAGRVVNLHCRADGALERFERRMRADARNRPASVTALVERSRSELAMFSEPLALGVPVLEVDATDGYQPPIEDVLTWVASHREAG